MPAWIPATLLAIDTSLFLSQRRPLGTDAEFSTLNFMQFWQVLLVSMWLARVASTDQNYSVGPNLFGKPLWRVGIFLASAAFLTQVTPKPRVLGAFHEPTT